MKRIPKKLPVLFFAGTGDPVGGYTKTIRALADRYRKNGMTDIKVYIYDDTRRVHCESSQYETERLF